MTTALHIVHPYCYKMSPDGTLNLGPYNDEQCEHVGSFVNHALERNIPTFHHRVHDQLNLAGELHDLALHIDDHLKILLDERITSFVTSPQGTPFPDDRPESIPQERWDHYTKIFITDSRFKQLVGTPDTVFFIGGYLEYCLANASGYYAAHHRAPNQRLCIVEDLSVHYPHDRINYLFSELKNRDIEIINLETALSLLT